MLLLPWSILALTSHVGRFEMVLTGLPIFVWLGLAVRATVRVRKEPYLEPSRRRLQFLLSWLPPFLGAIVILAFHGAEDNPYVDDGFDANPGNQSPY